MSLSFLVVGAGFFGAVCARELADAGRRVTVIEKRDHPGGNCFTRFVPEAGCHEHVYGAHVFHTGRRETWDYLHRFTEFNGYVHRVPVRHRETVYSFPINLFTLQQVFGVSDPASAEARLCQERMPVENPVNLEDWCLSQIGPKLYEIFVRGYTQKQWGRPPRDLPSEIVRRVPVRLTFDDRYYSDRFQGIPAHGYTAIFEKLLAGIPLELQTDFLSDRDRWLRQFDHIVYSGPIDAFFDYSEGILGYRSLRFEREMLPSRDFQGAAVVNYTAAEVPYTRILEHKHFDQNLAESRTLITREYPQDWNPGQIEFYPIGTRDNQDLYHRYKRLAERERLPVTFGGRLGTYRYLDMGEVVASARETAQRLLGTAEARREGEDG